MGKSALLNEYANRQERRERSFVINIKGSDLVSQKPVQDLSTAEHIHDWQQRFCMCINREIGNSIQFAADDDDEILLVENSELLGLKKRNLLGSLVDCQTSTSLADRRQLTWPVFRFDFIACFLR